MRDVVTEIARVIDPDAWESPRMPGMAERRESALTKVTRIAELLREPTNEMMTRGAYALSRPGHIAFTTEAEAVWKAMIDEMVRT